MKERIRRWWVGEFVAPENDPNSDVIIITGHHERHWTSKTARAVLGFLSKEWKWVIGIALTITGLVMSYIRFF